MNDNIFIGPLWVKEKAPPKYSQKVPHLSRRYSDTLRCTLSIDNEILYRGDVYLDMSQERDFRTGRMTSVNGWFEVRMGSGMLRKFHEILRESKLITLSADKPTFTVSASIYLTSLDQMIEADITNIVEVTFVVNGEIMITTK